MQLGHVLMLYVVGVMLLVDTGYSSHQGRHHITLRTTRHCGRYNNSMITLRKPTLIVIPIRFVNSPVCQFTFLPMEFMSMSITARLVDLDFDKKEGPVCNMVTVTSHAEYGSGNICDILLADTILTRNFSVSVDYGNKMSKAKVWKGVRMEIYTSEVSFARPCLKYDKPNLGDVCCYRENGDYWDGRNCDLSTCINAGIFCDGIRQCVGGGDEESCVVALIAGVGAFTAIPSILILSIVFVGVKSMANTLCKKLKQQRKTN